MYQILNNKPTHTHTHSYVYVGIHISTRVLKVIRINTIAFVYTSIKHDYYHACIVFNQISKANAALLSVHYTYT